MIYTLEDAAKAFPDFSVSDLRNYIKRRLLCSVGDTPVAGQPRRFDIFGMYEIGFMQALSRQGVDLTVAAKILCPFISGERGLSRMKAVRDGLDTDVVYGQAANLPLSATLSFSNLDNPILFIFDLANAGIATSIVFGWDDLQGGVNRVYHRWAMRHYMPPFVAKDVDVTETPQPSQESIFQAGRELVMLSIFNVTAAGLQVKDAIEGLA